MNPERCIDLVPARHNDQDIHVAVFVGRAVSVGAEEDDLVRLEALGDIAGEFPNDAQRHIWARVIAPGLVAESGGCGHGRSLQCGEPQLQSGRRTAAKFVQALTQFAVSASALSFGHGESACRPSMTHRGKDQRAREESGELRTE